MFSLYQPKSHRVFPPGSRDLHSRSIGFPETLGSTLRSSEDAKFFLAFLVGAVLGTGTGVALGFFLFPFVFPPPVAMDALSENEREKVVAMGEFLHANPATQSITAVDG